MKIEDITHIQPASEITLYIHRQAYKSLNGDFLPKTSAPDEDIANVKIGKADKFDCLGVLS